MTSVTTKTEEFFALCKEMTFQAFAEPTTQDGIMMLIVQLTAKVCELEAELQESKKNDRVW